MKQDLAQARLQEQEAMQFAPPPLPPHGGEVHYQSALDADLVYRRAVLIALALAFFAGTGFGQLPQFHDWVTTALWCITAAGLAARCVGPRAGWSPAPVRGVVDRIKAEFADREMPRSQSLPHKGGLEWLEQLRVAAQGHELSPELRMQIRREFERLDAFVADATKTSLQNLQLLAGLVALFGILGCFRGGLAGVWAGGAAIAAAAMLFLMSRHPASGRYLGAGAIVALGFGVPTVMATGFGALALLAGFAGLGLAAATIFIARDSFGHVNVAQAFTRLAGIGWVASTLGNSAEDVLHVVLVILGGVAMLGLDIYAIRRSSFIPTIATAIFLLVGAALLDLANLHAALWAQIPVVALIFLLLIAAGYRHILAAMLRLPPATYRRAPRCIVPRLDKTWDHPVEIYVV